jgi:hypothetical protein
LENVKVALLVIDVSTRVTKKLPHEVENSHHQLDMP